MIVVIGGSGSGKSEFAEGLITQEAYKDDMQLYYLAAMKIYGNEELKKVERHRELRKGKGFITIEQPTDIEEAIEKADILKSSKNKKKAALLECISNLTANEMFDADKVRSAEEAVRRVTEGVSRLDAEFDLLVVVSNNVFEDGAKYDDITMSYIKAMGSINKELSKVADAVFETLAGIPIRLK